VLKIENEKEICYKLILKYSQFETILWGKITREDENFFIFLTGGGNEWRVSKKSNYILEPSKKRWNPIGKE